MRKEAAWARARGVGGGKSAAAYGVDEQALRGHALRDAPALELLVERLGALRLRGQHRAEQVALVQLILPLRPKLSAQELVECHVVVGPAAVRGRHAVVEDHAEARRLDGVRELHPSLAAHVKELAKEASRIVLAERAELDHHDPSDARRLHEHELVSTAEEVPGAVVVGPRDAAVAEGDVQTRQSAAVDGQLLAVRDAEALREGSRLLLVLVEQLVAPPLAVRRLLRRHLDDLAALLRRQDARPVAADEVAQLHRHHVAPVLAEGEARQLRVLQLHILLLPEPLEDGPGAPRRLLGELALARRLAQALPGVRARGEVRGNAWTRGQRVGGAP